MLEFDAEPLFLIGIRTQLWSQEKLSEIQKKIIDSVRFEYTEGTRRTLLV